MRSAKQPEEMTEAEALALYQGRLPKRCACKTCPGIAHVTGEGINAAVSCKHNPEYQDAFFLTACAIKNPPAQLAA